MPEPRVNLEDLRIREAPPKRGGGRAWLSILVLVPAAFGAGFWLRGGPGGSGADPFPVRVEVLGAIAGSPRGAASGDVTEGGWIEVPSYHPIVVSALIPGRVEKLLVLEGSPVAEGDTVAVLYDADLREEIRLAEADAAEKRARFDLLAAGYRPEEIERARAESEAAVEEAKLAEKVLGRTRDLVPAGAASREDLDRDEAALATARARARAKDEDRKLLEAGYRKEEIAEAAAALARSDAERDLAKLRLSWVTVKSPAKGVVLSRHVTAGHSLSADNRAVVSLYDPEDLQVRVDVRQENAARVRIGQTVEVTTDAEPDRRYRGTVIRVDPLADLRKNTIQAKVKLAETGPRLHPEMICRVRFLASPSAPDVAASPEPLAVPASAVTEAGGRTSVFVVRAGRAALLTVRVGEERDGRREVLGGLTEGDRVVTNPPPDLSDGAEVTEVLR
ncbi:MAG: efflux RND transporter periplasmic adaptor subunit [Planctomycetes bacterium]|jgi:RND family efflux transporter MFP subunit|nr:efflux RND transporter periplasmic adaptor subunit [Planctomycetota bacterium]